MKDTKGGLTGIINNRRKWQIVLFLVLGLLLFPRIVFANSPGPVDHFSIILENVPAEATGVDVLVPVSEIPADSYLEEKEDVLAEAGLMPDCGLASYDDGFVSCLGHYRDVEYDLAFDQSGRSVSIGGYLGNGRELFPVLREMPQLKLAVYDKNGDILAVSDAFTTVSSFRYVFKGDLTYDAASGHVDVRMDESIAYLIFMALVPFILVISALVTVLIELVVGVICSMRPLSVIVKVTALTNIGMNLLFYLLMATMPDFVPFNWLVILELVVIVVEYLIYIRKYRQHSKVHVLVYTVIANLASAMIGLLFYSSW
ncbi:MAG: hypothetical protein IJQ21_12490 [Lachnospiraceae bacterium]|nr:hypothetical protein [Lachnospiraceae bacterium]